MPGKFQIAQKGTETEKLPWGKLAWFSRPSVTDAQNLVVVEVELNEGGGHSFHKHPKQEEVIYVLSGKIEQWLEKEKKILSAGDAIFIPKDTVHASFNPFAETAKVLAILGPCAGNNGYDVVDVFEQDPWKSLRKS